MTRQTPTLQFSEADLALFSAASHDCNPLHVSAAYARATPFGERVVFGVLGTLAAMAGIRSRPGMALAHIGVTFRQPLFLGIAYGVTVSEPTLEDSFLGIHDGDRSMASAKIAFGPADGLAEISAAASPAHRLEPMDRGLEAIHAGLCVNGRYAPSAPDVQRLSERWQLLDKGLTAEAWAALLWCSYLVGMEFPGTRALFWSLDLQMLPRRSEMSNPLAYEATVTRVDVSLEFIEIEAKLLSGSQPVAIAKLRAFVRRPSPHLHLPTLEALLPRSESLRGKVAVVVGGSRGLGAGIVQALALQGCTVLATYRDSTADAERVRAAAEHLPGQVEMLQGEASDENWWRQVLWPHLAGVGGGVDILVCNASPAIRPLNLSLDETSRFSEFASRSLALVSIPMAALMQPLADHAGQCVLISSSYVTTVPAMFPHYVAAKTAAEGLICWAAAKYGSIKFLVARPSRLLTDQTNTPAGRLDGVSVERAAATIVARMCEASDAKGVEILDEF